MMHQTLDVWTKDVKDHIAHVEHNVQIVDYVGCRSSRGGRDQFGETSRTLECVF